MRYIRLTINILLVFLLTCAVMPGQSEKQDRDLSYEVSVSAQLIPIYAVDKKGDPVFDLKKEEIKLYADGKPTEVIYFNGYRVEEQQRVKVSAQTSQNPSDPTRDTLSDRIVILILDSLISNKNTYDISQTIARGIIKNAPPGDAFIIMDSNQIRGFQYIIGPEKNKQTLITALDKIKKLYLRRRMRRDKMVIKELQLVRGPRAFGNRDEEIAAIVGRMDRGVVQNNKRQYRGDIETMVRSVQELKYALRTINLPKTVFLLTANPQKVHLGGKGDELPVTYYRFMENAAKAINIGGSTFYLINPVTHRSKRKRTMLKFMTDAGHGKLIHGVNLEEIVEKVKKSTSAYYEMAFYSNKKPGEKSRTKIKCTRKGVEIVSIGYSEQGKPYHRMNDTEKKLFALSIVNRGSWSRIVSKVGRINYKKLPKQKKGVPGQTIEVDIPPIMRNRQLELVTLYHNPKTQKTTLKRKMKTLGERETIQVVPMPNRDSYFIIIDPQTPLCIYNQVI